MLCNLIELANHAQLADCLCENVEDREIDENTERGRERERVDGGDKRDDMRDSHVLHLICRNHEISFHADVHKNECEDSNKENNCDTGHPVMLLHCFEWVAFYEHLV